MALTKISKKITYAAAIVGALVTIAGGIGYFYNLLAEYKANEDKRIKDKIEIIVNERYSYIESDMDSMFKSLFYRIDSVNSTIEDIIEGNKYFAVGFRGDGSGDLWYRDEYGKIHKVYYNSEYSQYYYVNDLGRAVYL